MDLIRNVLELVNPKAKEKRLEQEAKDAEKQRKIECNKAKMEMRIKAMVRKANEESRRWELERFESAEAKIRAYVKGGEEFTYDAYEYNEREGRCERAYSIYRDKTESEYECFTDRFDPTLEAVSCAIDRDVDKMVKRENTNDLPADAYEKALSGHFMSTIQDCLKDMKFNKNSAILDDKLLDIIGIYLEKGANPMEKPYYESEVTIFENILRDCKPVVHYGSAEFTKRLVEKMLTSSKLDAKKLDPGCIFQLLKESELDFACVGDEENRKDIKIIREIGKILLRAGLGMYDFTDDIDGRIIYYCVDSPILKKQFRRNYEDYIEQMNFYVTDLYREIENEPGMERLRQMAKVRRKNAEILKRKQENIERRKQAKMADGVRRFINKTRKDNPSLAVQIFLQYRKMAALQNG